MPVTVWALWVSATYCDDGVVGIYASLEDAEAADAQRSWSSHHITEHVVGQTDPLWLK